MIAHICKITLEKLYNSNVIGEEDLDVYRFGLELLIGTIAKAIGLIAIAIITGLVKEVIVFTVFFSGLRLQAGGFHAKTIAGCFIGTVLMFFSSIFLIRLMPTKYMYPYILLSLVISTSLVFVYAPVENENRPLDAEEKRIYRYRSILTVIAGSAIILLLAYLKEEFIYISTIASTGFLLESLSLTNIMQKITNRIY